MKKINELNLLSKEEVKYLLKYLDPNNEGALRFQDFSSKIFPGMTSCKSTGEQSVIPSLFPAKERNDNMRNHLSEMRRQRSEENSFSKGWMLRIG